MWFVHKGILKEHQIKDHSSFKGVPGTLLLVFLPKHVSFLVQNNKSRILVVLYWPKLVTSDKK
jgi:hypothetical protein